MQAPRNVGTDHRDLPLPFEVSRRGLQGQGCTDNQQVLNTAPRYSATEEPNLASRLTSKASGARDQADRSDGVFPDRTSITRIGGISFYSLSFPFYNFEKDAIRLNHFSGDGMRKGVVRSVSQLEESVRFAGLSKGAFESLLAAQRSDCFRD